MQNRVYASVYAAAVLLLWAQPAGNIDRLLYDAQQHGVWEVTAGSATLSAYNS